MCNNQGSVTASAGTASANITAGHNVLMHIFIKATTSTTTFDVKLTDIYSNDVFQRFDQTGELNEQLELPAHANWTLTISNASVDEAFTYSLVLRES